MYGHPRKTQPRVVLEYSCFTEERFEPWSCLLLVLRNRGQSVLSLRQEVWALCKPPWTCLAREVGGGVERSRHGLHLQSRALQGIKELPQRQGHRFSWTSQASLANLMPVSRTFRAGGRAVHLRPTSAHTVKALLSLGTLQGFVMLSPALLSGSALTTRRT